MFNRILLILLSAFVSTSCMAQQSVFPVLQGYKIRTIYPVYTATNLWDFIDGAAATYLSYGFVDLHVAEYKKGKAVIKLAIYRHSDNLMAFGIYSAERSPSYRFTNIGAQGYFIEGAINFFKGSYYVKIKTNSRNEKVWQSTEILAQKVAGMLEGVNSLPAMLSVFPADGRKSNEESFINESVLGHNFLNKAFKASYQVDNDSFDIFVIEEQSSDEARKTAQIYIASTGIDPVETSDDRFVLTDGYNGTIFLAWKDKRIVIISGLAKDQSGLAERYSSQILR